MIPNRNILWARTLIDELQRNGLRHVALSPGSRSGPLAIALHEQAGIDVTVHVDERSGAYFALGAARSTALAAAVVSTSGTASANYLPAIVEADRACVPLIVLTADRPHELRDTGANQTIDQVKLYGDRVRLFADAPPPEPTEHALRHVRALACRAWSRSLGPPAGPVHINLPFREPLGPTPVIGDVPEEATTWDPTRGRSDGAPWHRTDVYTRQPDADAVARAADAIAASGRGLIVVGPRSLPDGFAPALWDLAAHLDVPVLADALSGVRFGAPDDAVVMAAYDAWLASQAVRSSLRPDWIVQFGAPPTSKRLNEWLADLADVTRILVDETGRLHDPTHAATDVSFADAEAYAQALHGRIVQPASPDDDWTLRWMDVEKAARVALRRGGAWDGSVGADALARLDEGDLLFVSSSLPVRDLDRYAHTGAHVRVLANRGASGIDGVLSTAAGAARANGRRAVAVLGDLALHHDLNGLAAVARHAPELTVVVLNNGGGAIFADLPIAQHGDVFEEFFLTPHDLDFEAAAATHHIEHVRLTDDADIGRVLADRRGGLVEIVVDREASRSRRVDDVRRAATAAEDAVSREAGHAR